MVFNKMKLFANNGYASPKMAQAAIVEVGARARSGCPHWAVQSLLFSD